MLQLIRTNRVLIGFIGITLFLAQVLNIWIDEAYTLETTSRTLGEAIQRSVSYEIQPPLYFALLTLWRQIHSSIFFARLFSLICMAIALYLSTGLVKRYLPGIQPSWATAVLALHPYAIWAAVEIRTYAFCVLLSVLLLQFFYDGYLSEASTKATPGVWRARISYGLTAIAALYTHYFLACLLVGNGAVLLLLRRWPQLRHYVAMMLLAGGCFLPLLSFLLVHLGGGGAYTEQVSLLTGLRTALARSLIFAFPTVTDWEGLRPVRLLRYGLALAIVLIVVVQRRRITSSHVAIWGITGATGVTFGLVLDLTQTIDLAYRYGYVLFVVSVLSMLAVLSLLRGSEPERNLKSSTPSQLVLGIWAVLIIALYSAAFAVTYAPLAKDGDWQRVANQITQLEQPNQPVMIFAAEAALPFNYYYKGQNAVIPLPNPVSQTEYNKDLFKLTSQAQLVEAVNQAGNPSQLWLVTGPMFVVRPASPTCPVFNFDFNCNILEQFVAKYYKVESDQSFYGSRVRKLSLVQVNSAASSNSPSISSSASSLTSWRS
jgi:hypothetical protein